MVISPSWDNGGETDAGAATWGNGLTGVSGEVSAGNSLVGSTAGDQVSSNGVTALNNGNYVVQSSYWDYGQVQDAGAATWGDSTTGTSGTVSLANSLVFSMGCHAGLNVADQDIYDADPGLGISPALDYPQAMALSTVACAVKTMTAKSGRISRARRITSTPCIPGMTISSTIKS